MALDKPEQTAQRSILKILIIDDAEAFRTVTAQYLKRAGYSVLTAENGRIGIDLVVSEHPDVALVDLRMPEMDGLEVISHIQALTDETAIIVVSGQGDMDDAIEAVRRGAWDYVTKPITPWSVLGHAIEKAGSRLQLQRENRAYREKLETMVSERTAELLAAQRAYQRFSRHLQLLNEAEMNRIARIVHDQLAQPLIACKMHLGICRSKLTADFRDLNDKAHHIELMLDEIFETTKSLLSEIRPGPLEELGLASAIDWLVEDIFTQSSSGIDVNLQTETVNPEYPVALVIFPIAKEALTNIVRHSGADQATVKLTARGGSVLLNISDQGRGMSDLNASMRNGFGIFRMREMAEMFDGEFVINTHSDRGT